MRGLGLYAIGASVGCTVVDGLFVPSPGADAASGPNTGLDASSSADGGVSEGGVSLPGDAGAGLDGDTPDALSLCPITPCGAGDVCCYVSKSATSGAYRCMPSCPNDVKPVECAGPQQCSTGNPICCGTMVLGPGTIPNCPAVSMSSACTTSCTTNIALGCNATDTLRLCHVKADCAGDPGNPNCCTLPGSGLSSFLCVSDLFRNALSLQCAP